MVVGSNPNVRDLDSEVKFDSGIIKELVKIHLASHLNSQKALKSNILKDSSTTFKS